MKKSAKGNKTTDLDQPKTFLLYGILGIEKTASHDEVKKAYRKMALIHHPDKNPGNDEAQENFTKLAKAYEVLSDPKKRTRYDAIGDDDSEDGFSSNDWASAYEYYRAMNPVLTKKDIVSFEDSYRGTKDEEADLLEFYDNYLGDLTNLLECIIASRNEDIARYVTFFKSKIEEGDIQETKAFLKSQKKIKLLPNEKGEAKKAKNQMKEENKGKAAAAGGSMEDLQKSILARRQGAFSGLMNYMEAKYGAMDQQEEEELSEEDKGPIEKKNLQSKRIKKAKQSPQTKGKVAKKKRS